MPGGRLPCQRRTLRLAGITCLGATVAIVIALTVSLGRTEKHSSSTLKLVSVIFRHGDRTPTETYPEDPYKDDKYWPEGWGALTNKGKMEMYTLGKFLRQRYNSFLSETYYPQELYVRSSDHDRCLMSAETCLAGLYPPKGDQVWNPELLWQPIPIHATPRNLDALIVMKKPCPRYEKELQEANNSPEIKKINEENSELYKYLSKHTGKPIQSILDVEYLYNTLEIEEKRKLQLPDWTDGYYPEKLKTLAAKSLALFSESQTMKRLNGGPLVKHIIEKMLLRSNTSRSPSQKFLMFSAHDITIVNVLQTMGFTELLKPDYGAMVMIELHSADDTDYEVKVLYLNSASDSEPHVLGTPGCTDKCHLHQFVDLVKPFIPNDWTVECQNLDS